MSQSIPRRRAVPAKDGPVNEWGARGYSCGLWIDPPNRQWLHFSHDTDEPVLVIQGRLRLEVEARGVELQKGDEALIPAGVRHSVFDIGGTEARWYYGYKR